MQRVEGKKLEGRWKGERWDSWAELGLPIAIDQLLDLEHAVSTRLIKSWDLSAG